MDKTMHRTICLHLMRNAAVLCACLLYVTIGLAEVPPAPSGFASENDVKAAFISGKLKAIDLTIDVPATITVEKGIEYGKGGETSLKLDLYSPKDHSKAVPAVIFIHGGAWKSGYRQMYHY